MVANVNGFTLVHSTLDAPEKWGYVSDVFAATASFSYQQTAVCFCGHTHVPVVFEKAGTVTKAPLKSSRVKFGTKYFVNVGSVGQPRDRDPRAAYVTYDTKQKQIELHRVTYDISAAQDKIRTAGLPDELAERLALARIFDALLDAIDRRAQR